MKTTNWNSILVVIGAVLVLGLVGTQSIFAEEQTDAVLHELKQIEMQINELRDSNNAFNIEKLGVQAFKFRIIEDSLLDIQKSNDKGTIDGKQVSKILDYLINDYKEIHETYVNKVSNYQNHNGLSSTEQLILNDITKNEITFDIQYGNDKAKDYQQQFIQSELQRLQNESEFQNLINEIGIKLADESNGNKIPNIHHQIALDNIVANANWKLAPAALDRLITQYSDENTQVLIIKNKAKILDLLEKLDEVNQQKPQIYTLTSGYAYVFFGDVLDNEYEIHTPHILSSEIKSEISSLTKQVNSIIEKNEKRIHETQIAQIINALADSKNNNIVSSQSEQAPEPESAPEPENNNAGNGNSNGNGNDNGKGKGKKA